MANHEASQGRYYPKLAYLEFRISPAMTRVLKPLYDPEHFEQQGSSVHFARSVVFLPSQGVGAGETLHETIYRDIPDTSIRRRDAHLNIQTVIPEILPPRGASASANTKFGSNILLRLRFQDQVAEQLGIATARPIGELSVARFDERQERSRDLSLGLTPDILNRKITTDESLRKAVHTINEELVAVRYRPGGVAYPYYVQGHPTVKFVDQRSTRVRVAHEREESTR